MGEAADDLFDATLSEQATRKSMEQAKCIPCPNCRQSQWLKDIECPVCHDLGWLDRNNQPCEP